MRWQSPNADFFGSAPRFSPVSRAALQRLAGVVFVVISNLREDGAIGAFDLMQFVIGFGWVVAFASRDFADPFPGQSIVLGNCGTDSFVLGPELFSQVKESAVG